MLARHAVDLTLELPLEDVLTLDFNGLNDSQAQVVTDCIFSELWGEEVDNIYN